MYTHKHNTEKGKDWLKTLGWEDGSHSLRSRAQVPGATSTSVGVTAHL